MLFNSRRYFTTSGKPTTVALNLNELEARAVCQVIRNSGSKLMLTIHLVSVFSYNPNRYIDRRRPYLVSTLQGMIDGFRFKLCRRNHPILLPHVVNYVDISLARSFASKFDCRNDQKSGRLVKKWALKIWFLWSTLVTEVCDAGT
jgi:hypothetical protein